MRISKMDDDHLDRDEKEYDPCCHTHVVINDGKALYPYPRQIVMVTRNRVWFTGNIQDKFVGMLHVTDGKEMTGCDHYSRIISMLIVNVLFMSKQDAESVQEYYNNTIEWGDDIETYHVPCPGA